MDFIAFANAKFKEIYDSKHEPLTLATGDTAYIKLHHGYKIACIDHPKVSDQRAGPFEVLEKVGK